MRRIQAGPAAISWLLLYKTGGRIKEYCIILNSAEGFHHRAHGEHRDKELIEYSN